MANDLPPLPNELIEAIGVYWDTGYEEGKCGIGGDAANECLAVVYERVREFARAAGVKEPVNSVPMPTNADQAAAMALIGEAWLRENAPERLRAPQPAEPAPLTVPQILELMPDKVPASYDGQLLDFARAIEAAHGIRAAGVKEPGNAGINF